MPLTRISLRKGKSLQYRTQIMDGIYRAMREVFDVPENDRFMLLNQYDATDFNFDATYLDIHRSSDFIIIEITANNTRSMEQKKALYAAIVKNLCTDPGLRPEDIFIGLTETAKENWSLGHGLAQYAQ